MMTNPIENEALALPEPDEFEGLVEAAETSLGFWDNPWDDEDWNSAQVSR
jgi:hypothetical protein